MFEWVIGLFLEMLQCLICMWLPLMSDFPTLVWRNDLVNRWAIYVFFRFSLSTEYCCCFVFYWMFHTILLYLFFRCRPPRDQLSVALLLSVDSILYSDNIDPELDSTVGFIWLYNGFAIGMIHHSGLTNNVIFQLITFTSCMILLSAVFVGLLKIYSNSGLFVGNVSLLSLIPDLANEDTTIYFLSPWASFYLSLFFSFVEPSSFLATFFVLFAGLSDITVVVVGWFIFSWSTRLHAHMDGLQSIERIHSLFYFVVVVFPTNPYVCTSIILLFRILW